MIVDYNLLLTNEQKRNIVQQRLAQFASEAYQHSLNKKTHEELKDEESIASSEKALEIVNAALKIHQAELDSLPIEVTE